jgi:hypothetical protein
MTPTAYLLAGLTGSGKTTYARKPGSEGVTRLSIDEEVRRTNWRASSRGSSRWWAEARNSPPSDGCPAKGTIAEPSA